MPFVYPIAFLGFLTVAVPLILHLRRKQEKNVIRFSALRFLEDQPVPQRSPLRLHDILLFLLRLAAVIILIFAFAWPYSCADVLTESRVYLLDNTLSHTANDALTRARDQMLKNIGDAGPDVQIAVIELTSRPRVLAGFADSRDTARRELRDLEQSFQRGSYIDALRQADMLLAGALTPRRRLSIFTDYQKNQWDEVLKSPSLLKGVDVSLSETGDASAPNLALSRPEVQRTFDGDRALIDFAVELYHNGDAQQAVVTILANGREIESRKVDLWGRPRSITLAAQWETDLQQGVRGEVRIEGKPDALAGDNRVFFSLPPMREGRVIACTRSEFLKTALSPAVMRGYWATKFFEPSDSESGRPEASADVLIVESPYLHYPQIRDLIQQYLDDDRGVLLLVTYVSPVVQGYLEKLGFELQDDVRVDASSAAFRYVFTDNPVFRPFRSPDFGNLMEIAVRRYRRLKSAVAMPLVFSASGDALLFQVTPARGRLFVFPFALDRSETNWPIHPTFIPFLDLCLRNAQRSRLEQTSFEPGETIVWDLSSEAEAAGDSGSPGEPPAIQWVLTDKEEVLERGRSEDGRVEFTVPDKPGLYTFDYGSGTTRTLTLSVNPPPLESDLTYLDSNDPVRAWAQSAPAQQPRPAAATVADNPQIMNQLIWWFLLLAGLAMLFIENIWVAARRALS